MSASNREQLAAALEAVVRAEEFRVPAFPVVLLRLQSAVADPHASVGKVAEIVSGDPALVGAVLGAANSAAYRGAEEVTSVPRAVNRLGLKTVSAMAMATSVGKEALKKGVLFDAKYCAWRRTISSAYVAQGLAEKKRLEPDRAFVVSLLGGVGRQVAIGALEKIVGKLKPSRPLEVADWLKIGERHRPELTRAVVKKWGLPAEILRAFDGEEGPKNPWGPLVSRAEELALLLESEEALPNLDPEEGGVLLATTRELPKALETLAPPPEELVPRPDIIASVVPESTSMAPPPPGLVVTDLRVKGQAKLECVAVKDLVFRAESDRLFQCGSMVHLRVRRDERELSLWVSVKASTESRGAHLVDFALFSPSKEVREAWQQMVA